MALIRGQHITRKLDFSQIVNVSTCGISSRVPLVLWTREANTTPIIRKIEVRQTDVDVHTQAIIVTGHLINTLHGFVSSEITANVTFSIRPR